MNKMNNIPIFSEFPLLRVDNKMKDYITTQQTQKRARYDNPQDKLNKLNVKTSVKQWQMSWDSVYAEEDKSIPGTRTVMFSSQIQVQKRKL